MRRLFCFFFVLAYLGVSAVPTAKLILTSPTGGVVLPNNTPVLSWTTVPCNYYKVYVDGILTDSLRASVNRSVPFPLSYGKHSWRVEAYGDNRKMRSETATFFVDDKPLSTLPEGALLLRSGWKVQSSLLVKENGNQLSSAKAGTDGWYATSLPATVLTTLVRNGVYPNPYTGMNNMRIPDSNDEYNTKYNLLKFSHINGKNPWKDPYWFRTEFELPKAFSGKKIWLNFAEINYRAEVWLNGKLVADRQTVEGMEQTFRFDISSVAKPGNKNYLAVAIYPVNDPGEPGVEPLTPLGVPGDNMGNGMISKSYTKWDAIGWDWQPAIRDREMGITEDVFVSTSNNVEIDNLYISSHLQLPDTTVAALTLSADIINYGGDQISGVVKTTISSENDDFSFENKYQVEGNSQLSLFFDSKNKAELLLKNPKLWWPNGYGRPNLYRIKMELMANGKVVATKESHFGIREVETYIGPKERVYRINGRDIYCKGGNWVLDMMLNWSARRYEDEILLTKNANLNMLRVWGPTGVPPQAFYDAADKHGIMIWQDFLNDYWGTFRNTPGYTTNDTIYRQATTAIIRKYRNHPSLVIWCGGNEGVNPREEMITRELLPQFDGRASRHYLKRSDGDGLHGGGPYHTLSPKEYFTTKKLSGFSSEIGPSGVPVYESVMKFMPEIGNAPMKERFPIDVVWAYHDANDWPGSDTRKFSSYDNLLRNQYGNVEVGDEKAIENYLDKAQILNYDVYRSSIESINRQLWGNASGILLWKSNSSWPSMTWQIYDWYLQAHAGYYGAKLAGEPTHIQMNRDNMEVILVNTRHCNLYDLRLTAVLYDSKLTKTWEREMTTSVAPNVVFSTGWAVPKNEALHFLKLQVKALSGKVISDNFYWLSDIDNYQELNSLGESKITATATKSAMDGRTVYKVTLKNSGSNLAFMVACKLQGKASGSELLPVCWSDNYRSLLPGEAIELEADINNADITESEVISCKAWNMANPLIIDIQ